MKKVAAHGEGVSSVDRSVSSIGKVSPGKGCE